jgi:hypothetical protein
MGRGDRHVERMGDMRNAYKTLITKRVRKTPLGRPSRKWKDNNEINLTETGRKHVDWINLCSGHGPFAGSREHDNGPSSPIKAEMFLIS